jgi:putative sterol carrier protein
LTTCAFGTEAAKLLERVRNKLAAIPSDRLRSAEAVYQIEIGGQDGGSLSVAIVDGRVRVEAGENPRAQVWLSTSPETLNKLLDGKLNATIAYMTKKLKIRGDITLAMKLEALLR